MPRLEIGMLSRTKSGFTLIEILVVLVIISVTLGFALLAVGDFGKERKISIAAEQFVNYLELIRQRAILESSTFGVSISDKSYQVVRFKPPNLWIPLPSKGVFRSHFFPENGRITIKSSRKRNPAIIVNGSGDISPFDLYFSTDQKEHLITVTGLHNGEFRLQKIHEK